MDPGSGPRRALPSAFRHGIRMSQTRLRAEIGAQNGCFKARNQALVAVGRRVGEGVQAVLGVLQNLPPMNHRAPWLRSAYLSPANKGLPSFQMDMFTCMPVPLSPLTGLGMKVAVLP